MYIETVKYEDYNGVEREEQIMFNLTESELVAMQNSVHGGMKERLERITKSPDGPTIMMEFKKILEISYGVKSDDGRRFIKSPELFLEFSQTEAYNKFFMDICTNSQKAAAFVQGIMPKEISSELAAKAPAIFSDQT